MSRPLAVVVIGSGPHVDPWHDLDATGAAVGALLADTCSVAVTATDELAGVDRADLVVVNAGGDRDSPPADSRAVVGALLAAHASGTPLLALHSSAIAFRDDPRWADLLGGRWVPEVSGHPPIGDANVRVRADAPFGEPGDVQLFDERYTSLERRAGTLLVAEHDESGTAHPLVWARDPARGGRVVYSALGHDVRSHESAGHRRLIADAVAWLLA